MRSFADFRKAQLRQAISEACLEEGIYKQFDVLRLDLLEAIKLPPQTQTSILAEVQYNQFCKQDCVENSYFIEQILQVCKEDFLTELMIEAEVSVGAGASLKQLKQELIAKIADFTQKLKLAVTGTAGQVRAPEGDVQTGSPTPTPGPAPSAPSAPAPGAPTAPAPGAPTAPAGAPQDNGQPAPYGSFKPSDGWTAGMGRLFRRATRPVRRIWHNDPNREMAKEHIESLGVIFAENNTNVTDIIDQFAKEITSFIDTRIKEIVGMIGGGDDDIGDVRSTDDGGVAAQMQQATQALDAEIDQSQQQSQDVSDSPEETAAKEDIEEELTVTHYAQIGAEALGIQCDQLGKIIKRLENQKRAIAKGHTPKKRVNTKIPAKRSGNPQWFVDGQPVPAYGKLLPMVIDKIFGSLLPDVSANKTQKSQTILKKFGITEGGPNEKVQKLLAVYGKSLHTGKAEYGDSSWAGYPADNGKLADAGLNTPDAPAPGAPVGPIGGGEKVNAGPHNELGTDDNVTQLDPVQQVAALMKEDPTLQKEVGIAAAATKNKLVDAIKQALEINDNDPKRAIGTLKGFVDNAKGQFPDQFANTGDLPLQALDSASDEVESEGEDTELAIRNKMDDIRVSTARQMKLPEPPEFNYDQQVRDFLEKGGNEESFLSGFQKAYTDHIQSGTSPEEESGEPKDIIEKRYPELKDLILQTINMLPMDMVDGEDVLYQQLLDTRSKKEAKAKLIEIQDNIKASQKDDGEDDKPDKIQVQEPGINPSDLGQEEDLGKAPPTKSAETWEDLVKDDDLEQEGKQKCPVCNDDGENNPDEDCEKCNGTGFISAAEEADEFQSDDDDDYDYNALENMPKESVQNKIDSLKSKLLSG